MHHLLEVMKIIEGAVNADRNKVVMYSELLAQKLEEEKEGKSAEKIKKILSNSKIQQLSANSLSSISRIPVDNESRMTLADEIRFSSQEIQIFLAQNEQEIVNEFINYFKNSSKLIARGIEVSPFLLTYGPPGCGKTELAKFIASKLELPLVTARVDTLVSSFLGSTAKNIRTLFEYAMSRPCILFLDEFDAIGKLRDDQRELGELKRVVVSLLQNIDSLDNETVLIAATNHEHLLDSAIWRRFAYKVHLGLPDYPERKRLCAKFLDDFGNEIDAEMLALVSKGQSGAIIKNIIDGGKRSAALADQSKVDTQRLIRKFIELDRDTSNSVNDLISHLRSLDKKVFTIRRLSELFDISVGQISKIQKALEGNI